jgi:small subunit ribosomal protein S13
MFYIAGSKINDNKKIIYAISIIYGIGLNNAYKLCLDLGLSPNLKIKNLSEDQKTEILHYIRQNLEVENSVKKKTLANIERYISNGSLRGMRHR